MPMTLTGAGSPVHLMGGFTPASLSPALWLDASDPATLFQDAARTTPAVADGDPVGGWSDKSGNGRHCTQASATARPTLKVGVQNGRPVIRPDGVNDIMSSTGLSISGDFTLCHVFRRSTLPATVGRLLDLAQAAAVGANLYIDTSGRLGLDNSGGPTTGVVTTGSVCDGVAHAVVVTRSGTTYTVYLDGATVGTTGGTSPTYTRFFSAGQSNLSLYSSTDDGETFLTPRVESAGVIASIFGYCKTKWGTP